MNTEISKFIKFTDKGATTKIQEGNLLTTENWICAHLTTTITSKEFFTYNGMRYLLTSKVVKELN